MKEEILYWLAALAITLAIGALAGHESLARIAGG